MKPQADAADAPASVLAQPAAGKPGHVSGLVSIITPTHRRAGFLRKLRNYVRRQDYPHIEWLILDDSPAEFESCDDLSGPGVFYHRLTEKLSIGEKRNRLIDRARGEVIVQFDDDDYYAPNYVRFMLAALRDQEADLINLRGWFLYDLRWQFFGYWDLEQKTGPHYRCDRNGIGLTLLTPENNGGFADNHIGFGFSYAFHRRVWQACRFPAMDWNEDGEFSRQARQQFRLGGVHDRAGLCLHFVHPGSTSRCFPQHHLPNFLARRVFPAEAIWQAQAG